MLYKLQELLEDFMPRIDRNVDKIYKSIEGEHEGGTTTDGLNHTLITLTTSRG